MRARGWLGALVVGVAGRRVAGRGKVRRDTMRGSKQVDVTCEFVFMLLQGFRGDFRFIEVRFSMM